VQQRSAVPKAIRETAPSILNMINPFLHQFRHISALVLMPKRDATGAENNSRQQPFCAGRLGQSFSLL